MSFLGGGMENETPEYKSMREYLEETQKARHLNPESHAIYPPLAEYLAVLEVVETWGWVKLKMNQLNDVVLWLEGQGEVLGTDFLVFDNITAARLQDPNHMKRVGAVTIAAALEGLDPTTTWLDKLDGFDWAKARAWIGNGWHGDVPVVFAFRNKGKAVIAKLRWGNL
jgi:hypothetical protein